MMGDGISRCRCGENLPNKIYKEDENEQCRINIMNDVGDVVVGQCEDKRMGLYLMPK